MANWNYNNLFAEVDKTTSTMCEQYLAFNGPVNVDETKCFLRSRLRDTHYKYRKMAAELYFLDHGGNILDFNEWWQHVHLKHRWSFDLDAVNAIHNLKISSNKYVPTSVVVVSVTDEDYEKICFGSLAENMKTVRMSSPSREVSGILNEKDNVLNLCRNPKHIGDITTNVCNELGMEKDNGKSIIKNVRSVLEMEKDIGKTTNNVCSEQVGTGKHFDSHKGDEHNAKALDKNLPTSAEKKQNEGRHCSVLACKSVGASFYTYPPVIVNNQINEDNVQKCKQWVQASGNKSLLEVPSCTLNKKFFVCGNHFQDSNFYNKTRRRLLPSAVPTLHLGNCCTEEDMKNFPVLGHRKDFHLSFDHDPLNTNGEDYFNFLLKEENLKDKYYKDYANDMNNLRWYSCPDCKEKFVCKRKLKRPCLHNTNCKRFTADNDMDPLEVPEELKGLSYIEEQLISKVHPLISLYKIKGHQYGYKGNVINFPQDINEFAKKLPRKVSDLSCVVVRTQEIDNPKEFSVNVCKIRRALLWLKANNRYYHDIEISEDNLSMLPEDGNLLDSLLTIFIPDKECPEEKTQDAELSAKDLEPDLDAVADTEQFSSLNELGVPLVVNANQNEQLRCTLDFPSIGKNPIHEGKTEGYVCMAFPTLFPHGRADLNSPDRKQKVNIGDYFKHLLRYKDDRFQVHPRFRFFAMNTTMRWSAIKYGSVHVQRKDYLANMTIDDLKKKIKNDPNFVDKMMYQCFNLRGSKGYWKARRRELLQMIEQLGMPTLFFTLSAADLHWPGLFRLLAPNQDVNTLTEKQRRDLIAANPITTDRYFTERVNSFVTKVLKPKYNVREQWYRYEYQHRGSPHVHGILWLDGAPDVTNLDKKSDLEIKEIIDYFDKLICAKHPNINAPPAVVHPSRIELEEVIDLKQDLAELLNRVQRHTKCQPGYCIKDGKPCRFKFPKEFQEDSVLKFTENDVEYIPARDDPRLNKYNPYLIMVWRANIDIAPVLSKKALINYLAKYVSKSENCSADLEELLATVWADTSTIGVRSFIERIFIKALSDRDYSSQEVGRLIMGDNLVDSGKRDFVYVFLLKKDDWIKVETNSKNEKFGRSIVQKYIDRDIMYNDESLWNMAKKFNFSTQSKRKNEAIVMVYPQYTFDMKKSDNEEYFKHKVLLHVPWRSESCFPTETLSWEQIYDLHRNVIEQHDEQISLKGIQAHVEDPQDGEDEDNVHEYIRSREEWMAISAMGSNQITQEIDLGRRDIDTSYDWSAAYHEYVQYGTISELQTFIATERGKQQSSDNVAEKPNVVLNAEQNRVVSLVREQIDYIKSKATSSLKPPPKTVVVQGSAGTGKSVVIQFISHEVQSAFGVDCILLLAPTGVAALNIGGSTLHSKLHIYPGKEFVNLNKTAARNFCNKLKNVKFVIIDEYSMVGCSMLGMIDSRLRQATGIDEPFGDVNLYLFGDLNQLPPTIDQALYNDKIPENRIAARGRLLWENMSASIILEQVHRQADMRFLRILNNISVGSVTDSDYDVLKTRFISSLNDDTTDQFKNTIKLLPERKMVDDHNMGSLRRAVVSSGSQSMPLLMIKSINNNTEAAKTETDQAGGLCSDVHLGPSCKIMLRANLWTEKGLVNGSIGVIVDIVFEPGKEPPNDFPAVLICQFENCNGPFLGNDMERRLVPIPAITTSWVTKGGTKCRRTMFPVGPAYAATIHKSQGLTLIQVVIDIGEKEVAPGSTFVALSRAKALEGVLLVPFTRERFFKINSSRTLSLKARALRLLKEKSIF